MSKRVFTDVCIIGLGPAGIGAATVLTNRGLQVICLEAGPAAQARRCSIPEDSSCNLHQPCEVISGFGGAALFGGHKVSMFPAGSSIAGIVGSDRLAKDLFERAFDLLSKHLAIEQPEINEGDIIEEQLRFQKLGFDFRFYPSFIISATQFGLAIEAFRSDITESGVEILLDCSVNNIEVDSDHGLYVIDAESNDVQKTIVTQYILLCVGRSGNSLMEHLQKEMNLPGGPNHLELGVRLEFPSVEYWDIDRVHNDLKILFDDMRTFCVCKGGAIIPYYTDGLIILDGYYDAEQQTPFTNLAIMLRLDTSVDSEKILHHIRGILASEFNMRPVIQRLEDYLVNRDGKGLSRTAVHCSMNGGQFGNINRCYPDPYSEILRAGVNRFTSSMLSHIDHDRVNVFAPAIEYFWPRFKLDPLFQVRKNLFLAGDCTGQFRGLMQAFCSGVACGNNILKQAGVAGD